MSVIAFFSLLTGALIGSYMAVRHWRGKTSGMALGIVHGFWTLGGLALLAIGLTEGDADPAWWILIGFGVVALGGVYLFYKQTQREPWPSLVILAHGGLAIVLLVALGLWAFGGEVESIDNSAVPTEALSDAR